MANRTHARARSMLVLGDPPVRPAAAPRLHARCNAAFLTGVSLAAVGIAAPVDAATTPGISQITVSPDVTDVLLISDIGDNLYYGVDNSGSGLVTAFVNDPVNGAMVQIGVATGAPPQGDVDLGALNLATALINASAVSNGGTSWAAATAGMTTGVLQFGSGAGSVSAAFANPGDLEISAIAQASATSWDAHADAQLGVGIDQRLIGGESASASLGNSGSLLVGAGAWASATSLSAGANASMVKGVLQQASGPAASATLTNSGDFTVIALASALATDWAGANAHIGNGIVQQADGTTAATLVSNSGNLEILGLAYADGGGFASADADVHNAISQSASASGSAASVLTNSSDGTIDVAAHAGAIANGASATATMDGGIRQQALSSTGPAAALIDNAGSIDLAASAAATASFGNADARAIARGVFQYADAANGDASVTIANAADATFTIAADAQATAAWQATAVAAIHTGISQIAEASGVGDATAALTNGGTLDVSATASALGARALAAAENDYALYQVAETYGTGTASNLLANSGSVGLTAAATATAVGTGESAGAAVARASINEAVSQIANSVSGASDMLDNSGTLTIAASAMADSSWNATADASIDYGIYQSVNASTGDASATLAVSAGSLSLTANATANGLGYHALDPGPFYIQALGTYSWLNGKSDRTIDFRPLGGTIHGGVTGTTANDLSLATPSSPTPTTARCSSSVCRARVPPWSNRSSAPTPPSTAPAKSNISAARLGRSATASPRSRASRQCSTSSCRPSSESSPRTTSARSPPASPPRLKPTRPPPAYSNGQLQP
jgi:hypothetical protein